MMNWGATTIYVTHSVADAQDMEDRVVVMRNGHIMDVGTYAELT
jgi:ABC-type Fe3+/spermidine/putrescine transport system ATPase subunit